MVARYYGLQAYRAAENPPWHTPLKMSCTEEVAALLCWMETTSVMVFVGISVSRKMRRIGHVAALFVDTGVIVLTAFISPFKVDRDRVRMIVEKEQDFIEVYCNCPIEVCEQRDVKGLYNRARKGEISNFTGISSPYEEPENPDLVVNTGTEDLTSCVHRVIDFLMARGLIPEL